MATENDATTQQNTQEEKPDVQTLSIYVKAQDGSQLQFKIKKTTPLIKVFNAYCTRKGLQSQDCRFVYNGERLNSGDVTPTELEMEDEDVIDMMQEQQGG